MMKTYCIFVVLLSLSGCCTAQPSGSGDYSSDNVDEEETTVCICYEYYYNAMTYKIAIVHTSWKLLSFIADNTVLLFFIMLVLLELLLLLVVVVLVMMMILLLMLFVLVMMKMLLLMLLLLVLLLPVLLFLLLLLAYYEQNNIAYSNGVLAVDEGKLNTELTFSCNMIRSTTTSINNYIYNTPAVQAKDNGFYKSQLVL